MPSKTSDIWWKKGKLDETFFECQEVQDRMASHEKREESVWKGFTRFMLLGKVGQVIKLINSNSDVKGGI